MPRPLWQRALRRTFELAVLGAAITLTVANTTVPSIRREAVVREQRGPLRFKLDKRVYKDLPFSVELPLGTYSTLTLYRLKGSARERLLNLTHEDKRLQGKPPRVRLLHPTAEGEPTPAGEFLLVVTDEEAQIHELRFAIVDREVEERELEREDLEDHEEGKTKRKRPVMDPDPVYEEPKRRDEPR